MRHFSDYLKTHARNSVPIVYDLMNSYHVSLNIRIRIIFKKKHL